SLVTTPISSVAARREQSSMISELLPVPTGPQIPRRRARWAGADEWEWAWESARESSTEQPPGGVGVTFGVVLDDRRVAGRDLVGAREGGDVDDQLGARRE